MSLQNIMEVDDFVMMTAGSTDDVFLNILTRSQTRRKQETAARSRSAARQHVLPTIPETQDFFPFLDPLAERPFIGATPTAS